jgi:hypothetical protein
MAVEDGESICLLLVIGMMLMITEDDLPSKSQANKKVNKVD